MTFIPHTHTDKQAMQDTLGIPTLETLFDEIPSNLRAQSFLEKNLPQALTEMEMMRLMQTRATQDSYQLNFIGAGAYEHYIPAAVWDIATRGEWMTAYTPYQAEASQGTLQLIYEYQTLIANLTAMEVANASLYEGASALAEAILMAVRLSKNTQIPRIALPMTLSPFYRATVKTLLSAQAIDLIEIPFTPEGKTDLAALTAQADQPVTALVIAQPNFFGVLEAVDELTAWAKARGILTIGVVNPLAMALLKPPGEWDQAGVDIVCGELQPLGIPLASGGPYAGFLCCRQAHIRQMPGRIVGATTDKSGKRGFTLTLQAREQHIRRGKATSNICTNQGLMVTAATIYISLLGAQGLYQVANDCHKNTVYLQQQLQKISGIQQIFSAPFFHELVIQLPVSAEKIQRALAQQGILAGYLLEPHYPALKNTLLLCTTETKTTADIENFCRLLQEAILCLPN